MAQTMGTTGEFAGNRRFSTGLSQRRNTAGKTTKRKPYFEIITGAVPVRPALKTTGQPFLGCPVAFSGAVRRGKKPPVLAEEEKEL